MLVKNEQSDNSFAAVGSADTSAADAAAGAPTSSSSNTNPFLNFPLANLNNLSNIDMENSFKQLNSLICQNLFANPFLNPFLNNSFENNSTTTINNNNNNNSDDDSSNSLLANLAKFAQQQLSQINSNCDNINTNNYDCSSGAGNKKGKQKGAKRVKVATDFSNNDYYSINNNNDNNNNYNNNNDNNNNIDSINLSINNNNNNSDELKIEMIQTLLRETGMLELKTNLDLFIENIESQKNSQAELNAQFKSIQKALNSVNSSSLDKQTTLTLLQAFQNQLNNLSDRIETSEKMVLNLAKFLSNLVSNFSASGSSSNSVSNSDSTHNVLNENNNAEQSSEAEIQQQPSTSNSLNSNRNSSKKSKENSLVSPSSPLMSEEVLNNILMGYASNSDFQHQSSADFYSYSNDQHQNFSDVESEADNESKNGSATCSSSSDTPYFQNANSNSNSSYKYPYDLTNVEIPEHEATEEIAKKVKEYIALLKISQKNFAQSILNMKQANFSTLLSQPMSWSTLSKTYKDRFLVMYLWLNDFDRMDKLNPTSNKTEQPKTGANKAIDFKIDYNEDLKRFSPNFFKNGSNSSNSVNSYCNDRKRISFTNEQTDKLKKYFIKNPYPSTTELDTMGTELGLEAKKVYTWFTNQRQINKRYDAK